MRVTIRFFALQRQQTGKRSHALELPAGADVAAAWQALVAELPELAPAASSVRFARNGAYVHLDAKLSEGDELAVIPPVAGGSDDARDGGEERTLEADGGGAVGEGYRRLEITAAPLEGGLLGELRSAVASSADGAVVIFLGQTRETPGTPAPGQESEAARFEGQAVEGLTYEAFEPMALATLEAIADEIEMRFGVRRLAVVHRIGEVGVGEGSVLIVAASPHRDEAFAACRYAIEELKARAPIWKAERFADGRVWLGAPPRSGPADPGDDTTGDRMHGAGTPGTLRLR